MEEKVPGEVPTVEGEGVGVDEEMSDKGEVLEKVFKGPEIVQDLFYFLLHVPTGIILGRQIVK